MPAHLSTGGQVVVDGEGYFRLLPPDDAVGQREVHEEGLKGPQLRPGSHAQPTLLRQTNRLRHPGGDGIRDDQLELSFPCDITERQRRTYEKMIL